MDTGLDGVLFGGEAEGVEAHGVQDVVAGGTLVTCDDIGGDVAEWVADVEACTGGVWEHIEGVEFRF